MVFANFKSMSLLQESSQISGNLVSPENEQDSKFPWLLISSLV